jgi:UDP-N-acetylmuramate--alanine ligase
MEEFSIQKAQRVHIIGIGGIGISALARLLVAQGKVVSGTEDNESKETLDPLRALGVTVSLDLNPAMLPEADCYLFSDAWTTRHPEVMAEARTRNVPVLSYFEALGQIANGYYLIAVSGAHGKTTTTAMLIDVLEAGGLDPTAVVGSLRAKTKSNFKEGSGKYFVVEADEYLRHFLQFSPTILLINNIDADHLDYYKDLADIQSAFKELAHKIPKEGFVVCDPSDPNVAPILEGVSATVVDYTKYFDPKLPLKVLPLHRKNAAGVLAIADTLGIASDVSKAALAEFSGTWRRFEYKGTTAKGAAVYDDYAHHPLEIKTTLASIITQFPDKKIHIAFHPHLYSRTKILMDDFAQAFTGASDVVIAPIFAAREQPDPSVSSEILAERVTANGTPAHAVDSLDKITDYIKEAGEGDLVVTMGAGDIYKAGERALGK